MDPPNTIFTSKLTGMGKKLFLMDYEASSVVINGLSRVLNTYGFGG